MTRAALLILCLAATACKKPAKDKPAEPAATSKDATTARPAALPIADARLQALLDAWLDAQNKGDFAAYEKLYASKFYGIKRVGSRTYRYARDGWLADRKRMFAKKMAVEARDRQPFDASTRSATIKFVQRWASGKFEDLGPKRLMVVLEGDELKIAQEEMLRSEIQGTRGEIGEGFYFLGDEGLVLHDAEVPDKHGKPTDGETDGEAMTTQASVAEADLDEATRAWKGKKVLVDGECEATVTGFRLVSRVVPHFGYAQEWNCEDAEDDCVPATPQERVETAFGLGEARVVAELSGCDGSYAIVAGSAKPIDGEAVDDAALAKEATAAFGRLQPVIALQDDENEGWWKGSESVSIFKHPESGQVLVSVHARAGEGCGGFEADYWQLWKHEDGKLVPLSAGNAPIEILEAVDLDRDGHLELIVKADDFGSEKVLVNTRDMSRPVEYGYTYGDCPC
jgi:hypothetical protein